MARKVIDLNTPQPNGRMGEPTKSAWEKTNDNFEELYDTSVNSSQLDADEGASLIGVKQNSTSAVKESVLDFYQRTVSPEQFILPSDGSDWNPAFTRAIAYLMTLPRGGVLTLSPGKNYQVASTINIQKVSGKRLQIQGNGAMLIHAAGFSGTLMYYGEANNTTSAPLLRVMDLQFGGPYNGPAIPAFLSLQWANGATFERCSFISGTDGVVQDNSFAVTYRGCTWNDQSRFGVRVTGGAMNTTFERCGFYNVAQTDVYFTNKTYNINFRDTDFEGGGQAAVFAAGIDEVVFDGCYIEAKTSLPIFFAASSNCLSFVNNWLGYSASQQWTNISASHLNNNIFVAQPQSVATSCVHFVVGTHNAYQNDGSTVSNRIFSSFATATLSNGFTNTGGSWPAASYISDDSGTVFLKGMIQASADNWAFQLPVGLRPSSQQSFATIGVNGSLAKIVISAAGLVNCYRGTDSTIDLSGASFKAGG